VVSSTVYDQVHNKLSVGFDCLGQQPMKNVAPVTSYRVTTGGQAAGPRSFPADESPLPRAEAVARRIGDGHEASPWTRDVADRLALLPRPIAVALTISAFLVLINVFTGLHRIWFHWPVAALLFGSILRTVLRRRPAPDSKAERPTSRE
jgi:adenylate cyclase